MSRTVAVVWHALFSIAAGVLYFFFVLPRWPELVGDTSHTMGTVMRIVAGALIGLGALPVVFTLLRTRRPEFGTPKLALTLRVWSIALHMLGGVLIVGTAISEIWLSLDDFGRWLFGIYGAAAAIFLLGVFAFHLAFVAELPPPPPRPLKTKSKKRRGRKGKGKGKDGAEAETGVDEEAEAETTSDQERDEKSDEDTGEAEAPAADEQPTVVTASDSATEEVAAEETKADEAPDQAATTEAPAEDTAAEAGLRNRRPSGKSGSSRRRRRLRGGVAVED